MKFKPVAHLFGVETWGHMGKRYSFIIGKLDEEDTYMASWEDHSISPTHSVRIDGSPFKTFHQAEAACRRTLKELHNKN